MDAGALALPLLDGGDGFAGVGAQRAQLIQLRIDAGGDGAAVGQVHGRLGQERSLQAFAEILQQIEPRGTPASAGLAASEARCRSGRRASEAPRLAASRGPALSSEMRESMRSISWIAPSVLRSCSRSIRRFLLLRPLPGATRSPPGRSGGAPAKPAAAVCPSGSCNSRDWRRASLHWSRRPRGVRSTPGCAR